uniref:Clathrin/coatomer adaptor adaptin-like N-terminal domain-containing protein n=2 Tax=Lotharella globosa TaxID=91324 RepID=A0A7S4DZT4_9EUKA
MFMRMPDLGSWVLKYIVEALESDPEPPVRIAAVWGLRKLASATDRVDRKKGLKALRNAILDPTQMPRVKAAAAGVLAEAEAIRGVCPKIILNLLLAMDKGNELDQTMILDFLAKHGARALISSSLSPADKERLASDVVNASLGRLHHSGNTIVRSAFEVAMVFAPCLSTGSSSARQSLAWNLSKALFRTASEGPSEVRWVGLRRMRELMDAAETKTPKWPFAQCCVLPGRLLRLIKPENHDAVFVASEKLEILRLAATQDAAHLPFVLQSLQRCAFGDPRPPAFRTAVRCIRQLAVVHVQPCIPVLLSLAKSELERVAVPSGVALASVLLHKHGWSSLML